MNILEAHDRLLDKIRLEMAIQIAPKAMKELLNRDSITQREVESFITGYLIARKNTDVQIREMFEEGE